MIVPLVGEAARVKPVRFVPCQRANALLAHEITSVPLWEGTYSHQTVAPSPPGGSGSAFSTDAKALYALKVRAPAPAMLLSGRAAANMSLTGFSLMAALTVKVLNAVSSTWR